MGAAHGLAASHRWPKGVAGEVSRYFTSHALWACFWAACFSCFATRFSLMERPGFLVCDEGLDFSAMPRGYGTEVSIIRSCTLIQRHWHARLAM